ncbi:MAG TPA: HlyD family type I secretion periplasmic adaptor subunit [Hyphomicrobium sp.]|nr:HlyD family type I secretion periplasmic adaptor subunit [Hyphomicrobium sp.]
MQTSLLRRVRPAEPASPADWHSTEPWVAYGMKVVAFLGVGLAVASMLPINGAVVASGQVSVEGEYKAVQHLEGGIVEKILVKNGDEVKEGQLLVQLDGTQYKATLAAVSGKVADHAIQEARLIAERDRMDSFSLPPGLDPGDRAIAALFGAQKTLFDARRAAYLGQIKMLNQRLAQTVNELKGVESQLAARKRERQINAKELATVMPLFERGYVNQQRIGPLQREEARLDGEVGNLNSEVAKLRSARAEAEARLSQADKEYSQQAANDLEKVQTQLSEERETQKAAADKLTRTDIRAPVPGIVHALAVHTQGGVVAPGGALLQIVPTGSELIVSARFQPRDVDKVHLAQPAAVRFQAFDSHTTPRLEGKVTRVSAAELTDRDGRAFFTADVEVPAAELAQLGARHRLVPGMPAEVYLETPARTILSYFMKPFTDMMARAFRER